ncbi:tannase/feruloyl esterase family alpha/beta hydrolase [Sphingomonas sp. RS6]
MNRFLRSAACIALLAPTACIRDGSDTASSAGQADAAARCTALAGRIMAGQGEGATPLSAVYREAGPAQLPPNPMGPPPGPPPQLPAHCEVIGTMKQRTGIDGQAYAIRFHLRLPAEWNGRFYMQGGGGTNGELGDALGMTGPGAPALAKGYAVLSQDSGHDNAVNAAPERGGPSAFGFDPQARADYGGASLPVVVKAARQLVSDFYGRDPARSYFVGCSKGGQEGMMLAQRYPALFDGIVAAAPGMSLPRAAVAEAWDTQSIASAAPRPVTVPGLASAFSDADLKLVSGAVLKACDVDDGLVDGIIGTPGSCTSARVLPVLRQSLCTGEKQAGCLSTAQVDALVRIHDGVRDSSGKPLYASFPWDAGWSDMGWRIWKMGSADGRVPALNVLMGAPSLAMIFTTPPTRVAPGPQGGLDFAMRFDFDRDAGKIYATGGAFTRSAWQDIGARSPDLDAFRRRGGKMIVPHGVSDPVFSVEDTIAWWREVDDRAGGRAADTVRVFPVPGMGHCAGGPATDGIDSFDALVAWVERGEAPDRLIGRANPASPWPGRTRPVCAYPTVLRYKGSGDVESADSFECRMPG